MGSGTSSDSNRRGMKSMNSLKLQRLSLGMNQHQPQTFHQSAPPYLNNGIAKQQLDYTHRPTKLQLKPTSLSGQTKKTAEGATAAAPLKQGTMSKPEGTVLPSNPQDIADGALVGDAGKKASAIVEGAGETKKEEKDTPQASAGPSGADPPGESPKKSDSGKEDEIKSKKYTDEERKVKTQEFLDRVTNVLQSFSVVEVRETDEEGEHYVKGCRNNILTLSKSYFYFKIGQIPYPFIHQYRQDVAKAMVDHKTVGKMCSLFEDGITRREFVKEDGEMKLAEWLPLKNCILTLLNYSDASDKMKLEIGTFSSLFDAITKLLNDWREDHLNGKLSDDQNKCLKWCISVCHNTADMEENVPMLRERGLIQAFLPYLNSPTSTVRLGVAATLADMVNEEEAELLQTHVSIFKFFLKVLRNSLQAENHKHLGWSAEELTKAIRQLARNDANKKILVDEGCLPLLVNLVDTGNEDEVKEAINCLWVLSFKPENKMKMVCEEGLVHCLEEKFNGTEDGSLRHACHGILWSLRDQIRSPESPVKVGEAVSNMVMKQRPSSTSKSSAPQFKGHIMVSYQWGNQELIKRIVNELRSHNIPIWLDIDYMGGSTLQAMAQAVEDSAAVVIAMSQKYKDSPNTRAEAEYAFQLRKKIIPLIMQRDYQPDGWLGFILGSKLYYDFSGKHSFESRMEGLLKAVLEVKDSSMALTADAPAAEVPTVATKRDPAFALTSALPPVGKAPAVSSVTFDLDAVKKWTTDDKVKWLKKHNMADYTKMSDLQGEEIAFLHNLKSEAPEFFYHCLEVKLGFSSISDLAKVSSALSDLTV